MAIKALTPLKLTTMNSSTPGNPTMQAMASNTAVYVDVGDIDASRMIFVVTKLASGANSDSSETLTLEPSTIAHQYSANGLGNLSINISSVPHSTNPTGEELNCCFIGPFETARFKDSNGRINITCTNADNLGAIGVILI